MEEPCDCCQIDGGCILNCHHTIAFQELFEAVVRGLEDHYTMLTSELIDNVRDLFRGERL